MIKEDITKDNVSKDSIEKFCLKMPHKSSGTMYVYGWKYITTETKEFGPEVNGKRQKKVKRIYKWCYFGAYGNETKEMLKEKYDITEAELNKLDAEYVESMTVVELMNKRMDKLRDKFPKETWKQLRKGNQVMIDELIEKMKAANESKDEISKEVNRITVPRTYTLFIEKKYKEYKHMKLIPLIEKHSKTNSPKDARTNALSEFLLNEAADLGIER